MHHGVEALAVHGRAERLRIRNIRDAKRDIRREVGAVAGRDIVDDDHQIASRLERVDDGAADEAGPAGDEYAHLGCSLFHRCGQLPVDGAASAGKAVDCRGLVLGIVS